MHDQTASTPGFHELVLRPRVREAAWLAAILDPTSRATITGGANS